MSDIDSLPLNPREQEILDSIIRILKKELQPSMIILFGSRAKRQAAAGSDFDIAVASDKIDENKKHRINRAIEEISGLYKVDIVYLSEVDKDFRKIILKSGKVIDE